MALDIKKSFATNASAEVNGIEVEYSGTKFTIARSGNPKYRKMLSKLVEKHQRQLNLKDDAADALSDKIMIDVLASTILLGWDDLQFDGAPLPYSIDNAKMILNYADFRKEISKLSDDVDSYRLVKEEELVKN